MLNSRKCFLARVSGNGPKQWKNIINAIGEGENEKLQSHKFIYNLILNSRLIPAKRPVIWLEFYWVPNAAYKIMAWEPRQQAMFVHGPVFFQSLKVHMSPFSQWYCYIEYSNILFWNPYTTVKIEYYTVYNQIKQARWANLLALQLTLMRSTTITTTTAVTISTRRNTNTIQIIQKRGRIKLVGMVLCWIRVQSSSLSVKTLCISPWEVVVSWLVIEMEERILAIAPVWVGKLLS